MPPKFSPEELEQIQRFQEEEGLWVDTVVRARAPRLLIYFAERGNPNGLVSRTAAFVASWYAKLEKGHQRHTETNMRTRGFRKAQVSQAITGITTTLYKHRKDCSEVRDRDGILSRPTCGPECVVASHRFDVRVQLKA